MFAILASVTLYRVIMIVDYCAIWDADSPLYCFLVTTIGSSVLNAVAILILGKVINYSSYDVVFFIFGIVS